MSKYILLLLYIFCTVKCVIKYILDFKRNSSRKFDRVLKSCISPLIMISQLMSALNYLEIMTMMDGL